MKKVIIPILTILLLLSFVYVVKADDSKSMTISDFVLLEKTDGVQSTISEIDGLNITADISFNELNDYVKYEMILKNTSSLDYTIASVNDDNSNDYITTTYELSDTDFKAGKEVSLYITMKYTKLIGTTREDIANAISVSLNYDNGETEAININPQTNDNIVKYFATLGMSLVILGIAIFKGRKHKLFKALIIVALMTPTFGFAIATKINFKINGNITINRVINYYPVVYMVNDEEYDSKEVEEFTNAENLNAPNIPGYEFAYWMLEGTTTAYDFNSEVTGEITLVAKYNLKKQTITYNLNGGTATNPTSYTIEDEIVLVAPQKVGYNFVGWTGSNGTTPEIDVTVAAGTIGNLTYTANYEVIYYDITYVLNEGSATNPTQYTVEDEITLNAPVRDKYVFDGWTGSNGTTPETSVTISKGTTGDLNYTANFSKIKYDINIVAGIGIESVALSGWTNSGTSQMTKKLEDESELDLTTITVTYKAGYSGINYSASNGGVAGNTLTVASENTITIDATELAAPTCTISGAAEKVFNYEDTTVTAVNDTEYDSGVVVTYQFGYATTPTGTLANFGEEQSSNELVILKDAYRGTRYYGAKVVATGEGELTASCESVENAGVTIRNAQINFNAEANGGVIDGSPVRYVAYGFSQVFSGPTNTTNGIVPGATKNGYTFDGWYTNIDGDNKVIGNTGMVQASVEGWTNSTRGWLRTDASQDPATVDTRMLYAHYSPRDYTLTIDAQGGIIPETDGWALETGAATGSKVVTFDSVVGELPVPENGENIFVEWNTNPDGSGDTIDETTIYTISSDKIIYAIWTDTEFTVTYNLNGGDADNPTNLTIDDTYTLVNPTKDGYEFIGWTGSNGDIPQTEVTIDKNLHGDLVFTANYEAIEYEITYDLGGGDADNPETYTIEDEIILNPPVKDGATFVGWTGTNIDVPQQDVTISAGTTGDLHYVANYE